MDLTALDKMTESQARVILTYREQRDKKKSKLSPFQLKEFCSLPDKTLFHKQYEFIVDDSRFKTLCKSRRAGGTMALAGKFLKEGLEKPNVNMAYITLDRSMSERIIWPELVKINQNYHLGIEFNQQKLIARFPNGSYLYLAGGKDRHEINKIRGKAFSLVGVDECQSFRHSIMDPLVNDVLEASLVDYNGSIILVGTPNALCAGYFYDACLSNSWTHYSWSMEVNPWLPFKSGRTIKELQQEHLSRKGLTRDDPTFQREWLGNWVKDENALIYKFLDDRNIIDELPDSQEWLYILGADIGWHDHDAVVIWAFSKDRPNLYCVYSKEYKHQDISSFAEVIKALEKRYGHFTKRVLDTGGLGKKICEELKQRHGIYFEAADKVRKQEYIKLMNSDFQQGIIQTLPNLEVIEEWKMNQWNMETDPPIEDDQFSNDLADAALYGWREAKHFAYRKPKDIPLPGTDEWLKKQWDDIAREDQKKEKMEWWEDGF